MEFLDSASFFMRTRTVSFGVTVLCNNHTYSTYLAPVVVQEIHLAYFASLLFIALLLAASAI